MAAKMPHSSIEIVAICDIDPKKLKDISDSKYDVYLSAEEMFENAAINTVLLTVPNHLHKEIDQSRQSRFEYH